MQGRMMRAMLNCPNCGGKKGRYTCTKVVLDGERVNRRNECGGCGYAFTSVEVHADKYVGLQAQAADGPDAMKKAKLGQLVKDYAHRELGKESGNFVDLYRSRVELVVIDTIPRVFKKPEDRLLVREAIDRILARIGG